MAEALKLKNLICVLADCTSVTEHAKETLDNIHTSLLV